MMRLKIEPDFDTWYIILDGMLRRGEIQIANDLLEEMARRGYEPTGALFGLVKRIRGGAVRGLVLTTDYARPFPRKKAFPNPRRRYLA
jgi:pentatricopeptide repeat protein